MWAFEFDCQAGSLTYWCRVHIPRPRILDFVALYFQNKNKYLQDGRLKLTPIICNILTHSSYETEVATNIITFLSRETSLQPGMLQTNDIYHLNKSQFATEVCQTGETKKKFSTLKFLRASLKLLKEFFENIQNNMSRLNLSSSCKLLLFGWFKRRNNLPSFNEFRQSVAINFDVVLFAKVSC